MEEYHAEKIIADGYQLPSLVVEHAGGCYNEHGLYLYMYCTSTIADHTRDSLAYPRSSILNFNLLKTTDAKKFLRGFNNSSAIHDKAANYSDSPNQ